MFTDGLEDSWCEPGGVLVTLGTSLCLQRGWKALGRRAWGHPCKPGGVIVLTEGLEDSW